jgi:hypothetical protein
MNSSRNSMRYASPMCVRPVQISLQFLVSLRFKKPTLQSLCDRALSTPRSLSTSERSVSAHGSTIFPLLAFAKHHLVAQTDWGKIMFVDETSVWLCSDHRWLWRKRSDDRDDVRNQKTKFPKKAMMFAGISKRRRTPVVTVAERSMPSSIVMAVSMILDSFLA